MKYVSCELAEHGICFMLDGIWSCCYSPIDLVKKDPGRVILIEPYYGESIDWDKLFGIIEQRRENFKKGIIQRACQNCYWLKEKEWDETRYIDQIYITHFERCNANCFYCTGCQGRKRNNWKKPYGIMHVLDDMKKREIMPKGAEIHIGGGEPTLFHEMDKILKEYALTKYTGRISVPSSGIHYSDVLAQALHEHAAGIIVSLDSGCKETYHKIKRVNKFDKVVKNLRKYGQTESGAKNILLKYIAIPNINSNMKEFDAFLQVAKSANITRLALDIEGTYARERNYDVDPRFLNFVVQADNYAKEQGFETEMYMFYKHALTFSQTNNSTH